MRLTLSVITLQDQAPFTSMSHSFTQSGGSVGRHQRTDWALLDDKKFLSGEHFKINCDGKDFFVVDTSTNGTFINDSIHPLGKGNSHLLKEQDRIRIGEYIIMASIDSEPETSPDFPLDDFSQSSDSHDPFFSSSHFDSSSIPETKNNPSSDNQSSYKSSFVDPNLSGSFGEKSNTDHSSDPFFSNDDSFKPNEVPFSEDINENVMEADSAMDIHSPIAFNPTSKTSKEPHPNEKPSSHLPLEEDDLFGFLDTNDKIENKTDEAPSEDLFKHSSPPKRTNKEPIPIETKAPSPEAKPRENSKQKETPNKKAIPETKNKQQQSKQTNSSQNSEAFKMFLEGAGINDKNIPADTPPETFKILGHAVKEVLQGTIELLRARAETKNHLHLDRTIIGRAENNPLKFMPNAEQVIIHILTKDEDDNTYTPLETALEEAYDDIMAHQFAMTVATQGALKGVMKQHFSPQNLADNMATTHPISSLIPLQRQAKLWNMFEELYDNIEKEAAENFQRLLDNEISTAYEKQLMELKSLRLNK